MTGLQTFQPPVVGALAIYQPGVMAEAMQLGELMASAKGMVPACLINQPGACTAVALQARIWNCSPFGLAAAAYLTPEGRVAYESKAIGSAAYAMGAIVKPLAFEPLGDWTRIEGKTIEKTGKNDKTYIAKGWTLDDERGLGVRVVGILPDGEVRQRDFMLASIGTRFSTLWASDPFQQLCYYGQRAWVRLNAPHVLLGVPDNDRQTEVDMGAAQMVDKTDRFNARMEGIRQQVMGEAPPPTLVEVLDVIAKARTPTELEKGAKLAAAMAPSSEKDKARAAYKDKLNDLKRRAATDVPHTDAPAGGTPAGNAPPPAPVTLTKVDVINEMRAAQSLDQLNAAADLIRGLADEQDREEATAEYRALMGNGGDDE